MRIAALGFGCLVLSGFAGCQSKSPHQALRLQLVDTTLLASNNSALKTNEGLVKQAQEYAARNRYRTPEVALWKRSEAIYQQLVSTVEILRAVRKQVLRASKGEGLADKLLDDTAPSAMLRRASDGAIVDTVYSRLLQFTYATQPHAAGQKLQKYKIGATSETWPAVLGATARDYRERYWQQASTAEVVAALAQQEAQIVELGRVALVGQLQKLQSTQDCFRGVGRVGAQALPESNIVEEGATYHAKLFFALPAQGQVISMQANGQPIEVDSEGYGHVEFTAMAPPGNGSRDAAMFWEGTITVSHEGNVTSYPVRVPYTVRRR